MTHKEFSGTRAALLVGVAALASACGDSPTKPSELKSTKPVSALATIDCVGDASSNTLSCAPASDVAARGALVIGGQGTYVKLSADPTTVPGPNTVTIKNVRLQNLLAQALGSKDGVTPAEPGGVRVFFYDLGNVTPVDHDDVADFVDDPSPYYVMASVLASGATSDPRDWTLKLAPGTTKYSFSVYVSAAVAEEDGVLLFRNEVTGAAGSYFAAWGTNKDNMFVVGSGGRIMHYDGSGYTAMNSGTASGLNDVWGSAANNVYAVGSLGTVLRFDGSAWTPVAIGGSPRTLWDVDGRSASNVLIGGQASDGALNRAAVFSFDGTNWTQTFVSTAANSTVSGIWAASATEAFAVGSGGAIYRLSGGSWTQMASPVTTSLTGVWGSSPTNVYAVGSPSGGTAVLLHYNGTSWTRLATTQNTFFYKVSGTDAGNVWVTGGNTGAGTSPTVLHWNGATWTSPSFSYPNGSFYGNFSNGPGSLFVAGSNSTIYRGTR